MIFPNNITIIWWEITLILILKEDIFIILPIAYTPVITFTRVCPGADRKHSTFTLRNLGRWKKTPQHHSWSCTMKSGDFWIEKLIG